MEFKDFVQMLYPIIGGSSTQGVFVRTLFDIIVTEEGQSILEEHSLTTYRAYYSGSTGISRIARKINPYIETENFVDYIKQFSDETVSSLCDSFRAHLPEINGFNVGTQLSELFRNILKEAASTKRKSAPKGAQCVGGKNPHDILSEKIFASGQAIADTWDKVVAGMADEIEATEQSEAEVVDDEETSGAADENDTETDAKVQIIKNATIVNQYGENCVHIDHVDTFKL